MTNQEVPPDLKCQVFQPAFLSGIHQKHPPTDRQKGRSPAWNPVSLCCRRPFINHRPDPQSPAACQLLFPMSPVNARDVSDVKEAWDALKKLSLASDDARTRILSPLPL